MACSSGTTAVMHARSMTILSQHIDQGLGRGLARRSRDCGLAMVPESAPRLIPSVRFVRGTQRYAAPYPGSNMPIVMIASVDERPYI